MIFRSQLAPLENRGAVSPAFDAISGKTVQANIDTGTAMVTKDNAADFGG